MNALGKRLKSLGKINECKTTGTEKLKGGILPLLNSYTTL